MCISVVISARLIYLWEILQAWDIASIVIWAIGLIVTVGYILMVVIFAWIKIPRLTALRKVQVKEKH